jgi:hypothetical protein
MLFFFNKQTLAAIRAMLKAVHQVLAQPIGCGFDAGDVPIGLHVCFLQ